MGIPAATTCKPSTVSFKDDNPIEFQGAWCAAVSNTAAAAAFRVITDDDDTVVSGADASTSADDDDESLVTVSPDVEAIFADDLDVDPKFAADLASLTQMFLQVEQNLFPGSSAMQDKQGSPVPPVLPTIDSLNPTILPTLDTLNPTLVELKNSENRRTFCLDSSCSPWSVAFLPLSFVTPLPSVFSTIAGWMFFPMWRQFLPRHWSILPC